MKKRRVKILTLVLLLLLSVYILWENLSVGVTNYSLQEAELPVSFDGYRIAHVSDLHNSRLWKQVIVILQASNPDIICMTGDLVDFSHTNVDLALEFAAEAVKIAPCYYITGNHELVLDGAQRERLFGGLEELGVAVLQNREVVLDSGSEQICLFGASWGSMAYMGDDTDRYRILLAHAPEDFALYASAEYDLVLSGHAHGGQFRIPFVGGLYAPGQGLLPRYDSGIYSDGRTDMVLSRGIGNRVIPIRFLNRPEVVLIELKSA